MSHEICGKILADKRTFAEDFAEGSGGFGKDRVALAASMRIRLL